jgi:hypothetical protein
VTAHHARKVIALPVTVTVPHVKALKPASRVNPAPKAKAAANAVAVAAASALTAPHAAMHQLLKT